MSRRHARVPVGSARRTRLDDVLAAGLATGEFYAVSDADASGLEDPITLFPIPANAARGASNATFRLPYPESAPKNADGSYKYRVYDAASLWTWAKVHGRESDPLDRTPLLRSDWEELRDQYSDAVAHPTPKDSTFRAAITTGLWPPGVPYVPPPPPPLTNGKIRTAVQEALWEQEPDYVHEVYGPIAKWDVSRVTDMDGLFSLKRFFNGDLSQWDVRNVTNMDHMFWGARFFNGDLSTWNVGAVRSMHDMFRNAQAFNGDLSRWDVRNVRSMNGMFRSAVAFNGDLGVWKIHNVTDMDHMFEDTFAYKPKHALGSRAPPLPPLSDTTIRDAVQQARDGELAGVLDHGPVAGWNVSNVTNMEKLFQYSNFNGDLSKWDVSNVTTMYCMFQGATYFNGDLSRWNVRRVTNTDLMFSGAVAYRPEHALGSDAPPPPPLTNATIRDAVHEACTAGGPDWNNLDYGPISGWDVSAVTNMSDMFWGMRTFNADLSRWVVSSVTNMEGMFWGARVFNGDLSLWIVSSVTNMEGMFGATKAFNGDLRNWDVSSVTNMQGMFADTKAFNGDLSYWDLSSVTNRVNMFANAVAYRPEHTLGSRSANPPSLQFSELDLFGGPNPTLAHA